MIIETIYDRLKQRDRKLSKSRFCKEYLEMDRNYWFVCNYNGSDISNNALVKLYGNLKGMADTWRDIGQYDANEGVTAYKDGERFSKELADIVMDEIERRALQ